MTTVEKVEQWVIDRNLHTQDPKVQMCKTMKGKTVEQSDLIGEIKYFPIEVVQRMVDEQVRQGNEADVKVFHRCRKAPALGGGFVWALTDDGFYFWDEVICRENFDLFFSKYPKIQSCTELKSIKIEIPD